LRLIACATVQGAEAEMAMSDERAHAELGGEDEGFTVVTFGTLPLGWVGVRGDLAEEAKHPRLVAAFLVSTGQTHRSLGEAEGVIHPAGAEIRLTEPGDPLGLRQHVAHDVASLHRPFQQRQGLRASPYQSEPLPQ